MAIESLFSMPEVRGAAHEAISIVKITPNYRERNTLSLKLSGFIVISGGKSLFFEKHDKKS